MAIEEAVYADFSLDNGDKCRVEKTSKGHYHIHIGSTLYSFKEDEFEAYARTVLEASVELECLKSNDHE